MEIVQLLVMQLNCLGWLGLRCVGLLQLAAILKNVALCVYVCVFVFK